MFMFEVKDHSVKFNESLRGFFVWRLCVGLDCVWSSQKRCL